MKRIQQVIKRQSECLKISSDENSSTEKIIEELITNLTKPRATQKLKKIVSSEVTPALDRTRDKNGAFILVEKVQSTEIKLKK